MMAFEQYVDLDRRFRDLTKEEQAKPNQLALINGWEPFQGITWTDLIESERVIILAEAGSGKTRELQAQVRVLTAQDKTAFFIPIEALDKQHVRDYLISEPGQAERFDNWLSDQKSICWFFLDAVDELKLVQGKLEFALGKMRYAIAQHEKRARIILTCRPTDWQPVQDIETFRKKLPESPDVIPAGHSSDDLFIEPVRKQIEKPQQKNKIHT